MVPELGMDWLIELTSEQLYGPTTLGALQEFLNLGEINADTRSSTRATARASVVKDHSLLTIPPEEPDELEATGRRFARASAPASSNASASSRSTLFEERRTSRRLKNATPSWKAKYVEIVKQRP